MRNTVKYVLAISSAAVVTAGALLLGSVRPAGAKTICSNSSCQSSGMCMGPAAGQNCDMGTAGCASTQCR
jgi:hypothetical protein